MFESIASVATQSALSRLSELTTKTSASAPSSALAASSDSSFGEVLSQITDGFNTNLQTAEANSLLALKGEAPVQDVVSSVMQAEQALQTAVAIRDKVVQAYLDISRMPI